MYSHGIDQSSMIIPIDDWLRSQLTQLQDYVVANTVFPIDVPRTSDGSYLFKPLFALDTIMIPMSKWCKIFKFDKCKGLYVLQDKFAQFAKGNFTVTIEVPHVYIGPHKGGQNFSLSLRIRQVLYNEDSEVVQNDNELIDELLAASTELDSKKKKRAKKQPEKCPKSKKATVSAVTVSKS